MSRPLLLLCALHLAGNALLLGIGYSWLGVGEANASRLALSAALLTVFVAGAAWLHGTSLAFFRDPAPPSPRAMLRGPLRRLLPLVVLALSVAALYFALNAWRPLDGGASSTVASFFTLKLQQPVRPASVQRIFDVVWWLLLWGAIPALLLPLGSGVAALGWRGFREFGARWKSWRYWLTAPALVVLAIWAPLKLVAWKPVLTGFGVEVASVIARFGLAYLLFVGTCLLLAFVTSRGKPNPSQPTTVPSP
jgi:hypothetical protein